MTTNLFRPAIGYQDRTLYDRPPRRPDFSWQHRPVPL